MAALADITFDVAGDGSNEMAVDLSDDIFGLAVKDDSPPIADIDIDNYKPRVYTVEGITPQAQQPTRVPIMSMEEAAEPVEDDDIECPNLAAIAKIKTNDDDDEFDFDMGPVQTKADGATNNSSSRAATYAMSDAPATNAPDTNAPATNAPATNAPATNAPATIALATDLAKASPPAEANINDVDVRLSFKEPEGNTESSEKDSNLSNILAGLQDNKQRNMDDDFDFDMSEVKEEHKEEVSAGIKPKDEIVEEELESAGAIAAAEQAAELLARRPKPKAEHINDTVAKYAAPYDPMAALKANGLLPAAPVAEESKADEDSEDSEDEWKEIVPGVAQPGKGAPVPESPPLVSYSEVMDHVLRSDLNQYKSTIKTSVPRTGFSAFKHFLFGPPKLHRDLIESRDQAFCLAICQLDNSDTTHIRMLMTLYRKLTGSKFDCQRFGGHWEQIGFQGNDPATDLRGCGMLGLVQLVYLVTSPSTSRLAADIYKLSLHTTQNFPFCIMGINMTRMVVQALREDVLNRDLNKRKDVFGVLNEYYVAIYYHLYHIWKTQQKTIADTGFVIRDVEMFAKKKPAEILKNYHAYVARQKSGGDNAVKVEEEPLEFTKLD